MPVNDLGIEIAGLNDSHSYLRTASQEANVIQRLIYGEDFAGKSRDKLTFSEDGFMHAFDHGLKLLKFVENEQPEKVNIIKAMVEQHIGSRINAYSKNFRIGNKVILLGKLALFDYSHPQYHDLTVKMKDGIRKGRKK